MRPPGRQSETPEKTPTTVLVADDVEAVRQVFARALRDDGFAVLEAADGVEALTQFAGHSVQVVVIDLKMPGMGGPELGRRVAEAWPRARMLFVTGDPEAAGAFDLPCKLMVKPFSTEVLVAAVRGMATAYWRALAKGR